MKVIFSHGKESGPWGSKITHLSNIAETHGFTTDSIDYQEINNPDTRVQHLLRLLSDEQDDDDYVLVGSSMGGYVSLVASGVVDAKGVFLLAPALYMPDYKIQSYPTNNQNIGIVHGWSDDVIPVEHSIRYAKKADCSLHLISGDHGLNSSLDTVATIFNQFLLTVKTRQIL